ncbi:DNA polymerase III, gamma and tau subunit [Luminiphilus syltensis NOR5-1B]|uniref:DNA polymerase III subunit gamma/tau n=2 Tax=Luminiphilus TaxID=1341118 RepID=B8KYG2_9GAMM|nr:DNA polymerase III, gamma and tau subunit [Luminiphilus syltensis NOR5-1B]
MRDNPLKLCAACVFPGISTHYAPSAFAGRNGGPDGPLAAIGSEPRQARKGATVITDSGAGVWLSGLPPFKGRAAKASQDTGKRMGYQVLARKWRPGNFQEMVGQQHVLRALVNALDNDRLHHAYLFTGTRGVGKTTVARILAKCLNCDQGVSSTPCGTCDSCLEIAEGRSVDLLEVDAASRTKVEDTRELLENVLYAPTRSRFKIYLIDEVHMLSGHSFNALLKTLEEPPPHAKFLLATTDPQKLPATVLSRCLQFNLKNMVPEEIVAHLGKVLEEESVAFDNGSLALLARAAEGSMRDALSLTDQAIGFGDGGLAESDVRAMLGTVDRARVLDVLDAILDNDPKTLLAVIEQIASHAPDYVATLDDLASVLHQVTIAQWVPDAADPTASQSERIAKVAASTTVDEVQLFYQFAAAGRPEVQRSPDPRAALEMVLLRMIAFRPAEVISDAHEVPPPKKTEPPVPPVDSVGAGAIETSGSAPSLTHEELRPPVRLAPRVVADQPEKADAIPAPIDPVVDAPTSNPQPGPAESEPLEPPRVAADLPAPAEWPAFFDDLALRGIAENIAMHCELRSVSGRTLSFVLDQSNAGLFNERHVAAIEEQFNAHLQPPVTIEVEVGVVGAATPAARRAELEAARQKAAEDALAEDPVLTTFLADFDAEVIVGSIEPPKTG